MVRHILRKDWRLLWPLVVAVAAFQILLAVARFSAGHFVNLPTVPASLLELLAAGIVIMLVVLQDAVPGVQQDWLIRPIRRRDLVLAKLLFVVVFVQGPWWITDVTQGLVNGFSFSQSVGAATACAAWVLLTMTIPLLAFAALASSVTESIIGVLALFATMIAFLMVAALIGASRPALLTGFAWVPALVREAGLLAAAGVVLLLQYGSRRTAAARAVFALVFVAGQFAVLLPWETTFQLSQLLTGAHSDDAGVAITFAPAAGRFRVAAGQNLDDVVEKPGFGSYDAAEESQRRRAEGAQTILFPVHVSGLPGNSRLLADRSEVRLTTPDGRTVYRGTGNDLEFRGADTAVAVHHGVRIPGAVYGRINDESLDVRLDYWFTLLTPDPTYAIPASGGNQRMPGIGWCATKVDDAGTRVLLQCLQAGERPSCLGVALEHAPTRRSNREVSLCAPDYSPYPGHVLPDALSRFGGRLPFFDPSGMIRYAVDGSRLSDTHVLVTNFRPTVHLVRQIMIPSVRLKDWEPTI